MSLNVLLNNSLIGRNKTTDYFEGLNHSLISVRVNILIHLGTKVIKNTQVILEVNCLTAWKHVTVDLFGIIFSTVSMKTDKKYQQLLHLKYKIWVNV